MSTSAFAINGYGQRAVATRVVSWELFVGCIKLAIVGPNEKEWLSVSKPEWSANTKPGTADERKVARRAIEILNTEHPTDYEGGMPIMIAAWRRAATEFGFNPDTFLH
jgi:hypothetical protein